MARFIVLCSYTDQGIRTAQDTVKRSHQAKEMLKSLGIDLEQIYWTLGSHDFVLVLSAPDGETLAAGLLKGASAGNFRTTTLRAFDEGEITKVLAKAR